jgi:Uma2 family endonuclease
MSTTIADRPIVVGRMTIPEFVEKHAWDRVEYLDGCVVPLPLTYFPHGAVVCRTAYIIGMHIDGHELGHATIGGTFVKASTPEDPTRIRGADFYFMSYARQPKGKEFEADPWVNPELIIEVLSPTEDEFGLRKKIAEYLANDVLKVVVLNFQKETAMIYSADGDERMLEAFDIFELPDILPGFSVPVAKFFA